MKKQISNFLFFLIFCGYSPPLLFAQNNKSIKSFQAITNIESKIEIDYRITLSTPMAKALKKRKPDFRIWKRERFKPGSIKNYSYKTFQSPSAVFGDFNGDEIIDAILMGHDKINEWIIAIVSKPDRKEYKVIEIWIKFGLWNSKNMQPGSVTDSDLILVLHHKGEIIKSDKPNRCSERILKTDAFGVKNFDSENKETLFPCGDAPMMSSCLLEN